MNKNLNTIQKISAYRCPCCSKVHLQEENARKCLGRCLSSRRRQKEVRNLRKERQRLWDSVRLEAETYDEIWELLIRYSKEHLGLRLELDCVPDRFSDKVSNTHGCPIGGVTNWRCEGNLPKGYPGWTGRFEGRVSGKKGVDLHALFYGRFSCDLPFSFAGFHTGTGCPGSKFSIEGYIFLSDFPKVEKWVRVAQVANRLSETVLYPCLEQER